MDSRSIYCMAETPFTIRIERPHRFRNPTSRLARYLFKGMGLIDLPMRTYNKGLFMPRFARALMSIRPHPLLCSAPFPFFPLLLGGSLVDLLHARVERATS